MLRTVCDTRMQLDLFVHNYATERRYDARRALLRADVASAETALAQLCAFDPSDESIAHVTTLIAAMGAGQDFAGWHARVRHHRAVTQPVANAFFGNDAPRFLAQVWRRCLEDSAGQHFDPTCPELHASWLHAQLGEWAEVVCTIEAEPAAQSHEVLQRRLAEAYVQRGPALRLRAMSVLFHLCWQWPDETTDWLYETSIAERFMPPSWSSFIEINDDLAGEASWFPAWWLCQQPAQHAWCGSNSTDGDPHFADQPRRAFEALRQLCAAEKTARQLDATSREKLKHVAPHVLSWYLAARSSRRVSS